MTISRVPAFDAALRAKAWSHTFRGHMILENIHGGVPSDPKKAEGWIKSKLAPTAEILQAEVAAIMEEREGISADEAAKLVNIKANLNGFKRTGDGVLFVEGRQLKACLKEAASVCVASGDLPQSPWGKTRKGLLGFVAEHIMVEESVLPLHVESAGELVPATEPTDVDQRFVHTFRGNGIQYEEFVLNAHLSFTVKSDWDFTPEQWALIWLKAEYQGLGAARSQGYGRFLMTEWNKQ